MSAPRLVPSGRHAEKGLTLDRRKGITFMGKLFYLDLPHSKQTQLLTKAICSLGGIIESFLSRDVNYVVTGNRKATVTTIGDSGERKGSSSRHPTKEKIEKTPYSRGKQLLRKVVHSQECSSVLSSARSWGVSILHVDELLEFLEVFTQRRANKPAEGKGSCAAGQKVKVGKLKSPFLKIEDQSRKYRPIHCSFSNFPECSFISSNRSPFETPRTNSTHKDRDPRELNKDEFERPQNWDKSGYCECCQLTYTRLSEHLISEQHCLFAFNASNYKVIDDITSRTICDLVPLPHGFKPHEEQSKSDAPLQSFRGLLLKEEGCLEMGNRQGEFEEQFVDHNVELPTVEHILESQHVTEDAICPMEKNNVALVENMLKDTVVEDTECLPENLLVEDQEPQCSVSTVNALVQCDLPLEDTCEEASHVGLVTEVSWYTEDTGLTSVYTVQSLVIPPVHVLDQHPELSMEHAAIQPPIFLSALGDPLHSLAQEGFSGSSNGPVHGDLITTAHIEPQGENADLHQSKESLAHEPQVTPNAGVYAEPSPKPVTESKYTLHPLGTAGAEVPEEESAVNHHQHVLLVSTQNNLFANSPCKLHKEQSNNLSQDQSMLATWHPAADGHVSVTPSTAPLGELVDALDTESVVPNTDCCGGKRKHCLSPCHPPAKRQPLHCPPVPMWVFHQLPSSMNQPAIPLFSDRIDRDSRNKAAEGEGAPPTLCFNPQLAQYEASSESDWDSQLVSQHYNNTSHTSHFGELTTAQVSLDESWYGKRLCSVLAHEQTLGSTSTTQTVTLSHTTYDLYLSGVAS
ncbi:protein DBF4 homolog B [Hyla sarda]|uniref:protein DBF4 homolog B n=1 Tax=Hyla sarda TaxID=327740 RepID=UPI0024C45A6B|nr:protein DBF4 homolog B [Hyla sarda]XP_056404309.1 protein DBF4 homolog B [Hyla sarda]